ncbi:MAG: WG repeat-containing protein, partial [Planctomycetia bacterium]|nr:WG repeat-containing protein [Planctomycetia bacterium]
MKACLRIFGGFLIISVLAAPLCAGEVEAPRRMGAGKIEKPERPRTRFRIKLQGKYGFIDKRGKVVIEPTFDWAAEFADGLAR